MEDLKSLNSICQKKDYKIKGNWMARHITRDMALPLSCILLHTSVTANQVTLASLIVGITGCFMFVIGNKTSMFIGALLLQLWYLLDHVDGQIARYRKQASLTGVYFDYLTHYIIHAAIFLGIGYGVFMQSNNLFYLVMGIIAGIGVVFLNLVYDVQYKAFFHKMTKLEVIYVKGGRAKEPSTGSNGKDFFRLVFSFMHKLCEVHVLMNIVTLISILSFFVRCSFWKGFLVIYAILAVFVAVGKNIYFVLSDVPDRSFDRTFQTKR